MKQLLRTALPMLASGVIVLAGGVRGDYVESRTADVYTGPCFANGQANQVGDLAVFGWSIREGSWQGVKLDGLSVAGVVKAVGRWAFPARSIR